MQFLLPVGGVIDSRFGVLTSYQHGGVVVGIKAGMRWAADNCSFSKAFDPLKFVTWLDRMTPYRDTCLFVAVPDVVADSVATCRLWQQWQPVLAGWPLAFVAQDGETDIPSGASAVFIGGSTEWKESADAVAIIQIAQGRGLHVHIGRVNWKARYDKFNLLPGSEEFTCDGTRTRFDGTRKTVVAWAGYQDQPPLFRADCSVPVSDSSG